MLFSKSYFNIPYIYRNVYNLKNIIIVKHNIKNSALYKKYLGGGHEKNQEIIHRGRILSHEEKTFNSLCIVCPHVICFKKLLVSLGIYKKLVLWLLQEGEREGDFILFPLELF